MEGHDIIILVLGFALIISLGFNLIQDNLINQRDGYIARMGWRKPTPPDVPDTCPHGRDWSDYCEPCGRVNSG